MEASVEAKRQYLSVLSQVMSPIMADTFTNMYKEAVTRSNRHRDQVAKCFIVLLEEIENWNNSIIQQHADEYEQKCHYFSDLLAAVFVCYVKILSSVRITKDPKKLQIKLPTNGDFIHQSLMMASKEFMKHLNIFREERQILRDAEIQRICHESIEKTLNKLIPYQQILRTYVADTANLNFGGDEASDPSFINEPEPESNDTSSEPEMTEARDPSLENQPSEQVVEEKTIPVEPRPPLFQDASENLFPVHSKKQ